MAGLEKAYIRLALLHCCPMSLWIQRWAKCYLDKCTSQTSIAWKGLSSTKAEVDCCPETSQSVLFLQPEVQTRVIRSVPCHLQVQDVGLKVLIEDDPNRSDEFLLSRGKPPVPLNGNIVFMQSTTHSDRRLFHSILSMLCEHTYP